MLFPSIRKTKGWYCLLPLSVVKVQFSCFYFVLLYNMRWVYFLATLQVDLVYRGVVAAKEREKEHQRASASPPTPFSLSLSIKLSLSGSLLCYQTAQWPRAVDWQADGPNIRADCVPKWRRQPPSVYLPSFLPSGPGPEPTSWEHGAGRLQPTALWEWHNERVHRKNRVRMWLGRTWCWPCCFGNVHGPMCGHQSCQKSKWCSINLALHQNLFPNDFWRQEKLFSLFHFGIVHLVSIWGSLMFIKKGPLYGRTHFMGTEAFQLTRTQQEIWHVIAAVVDANTTVRQRIV